MARQSNPYAMTAEKKARWMAAGIPGAENLKIGDEPDPDDPDADDPDDSDDPDEPIPGDPNVNYGPDGTGGPAALPGGAGDDLGQDSPGYGPGGPSSLPGIPGLGGPGAGGAGAGGVGTFAGPTAGAGRGVDYGSGGGPAGPGSLPGYPAGAGGPGRQAAGGGGGGSRGGGGGGSVGIPRGGYDFGAPADVGGPGQGGGTPPRGAPGSFNADPGGTRRERQEYLEDLKNYRTLDLPDEAVSGVNRLVESYNQAYGEARGANEARYQQLLGITDQTTGQRAADIRGGAEEERSDLQQGLARTGLANTTVSPTLTAGVRRREQESLNRLADQMQGTKLGIIERREDQYPDAASLQSSLAGLSEGYGGAGVSALYNALGNVQQGGGGAAPVTGGAGVYGSPTNQPAGNPLSESGLGPSIPTVPGLPPLGGPGSFGADQFTIPGSPAVKRKGGNVFGTL